MNTGRTFREKYNFLSHSLNLDLNGTIQYKLPEYWVQTFIDGEGMFYNYFKTEQAKPLTSLNHYPDQSIPCILASGKGWTGQRGKIK